jgi:hypothetical protein
MKYYSETVVSLEVDLISSKTTIITMNITGKKSKEDYRNMMNRQNTGKIINIPIAYIVYNIYN